MSTPITLSGFNDIDFGAVVTSLMAQASVPLTSLQSRQRNLQSQVTGYEQLTSKVEALRAAAATLGQASSLSTLAGTSSNSSAVSVSAASTAVAGHYDIVVSELARAQVTVSASSYADADTTIVAQSGTIDIGGVTVTIAANSTLQQLASSINATPGIGATATVVRTSATSYRLALTSTMTGAANAFTISNSLAGGAGLSFLDTDFNGISGDSPADNAVTATDAAITINNIAATSSSNTFQDLVAGVTLTVAKKDPTATVGVDIATDTTAIKAKINAFVTAYNEFVDFVAEQRTKAAGGDANSIGREPILRQLQSSLRSALIGSHGSGTLTRLAEAGVELQQGGKLKLNEAAFDAAIAAGASDVTRLFSDTNGAFPGVKAMLDTYAQADGLIPSSKRRLQDQITSMDGQIEAMQRRLALQRETLQRQFAAADLIMSRLKSQASSLQGFSSGFGQL